ncbi:c-type cytochrome biogenesis protein CcmI [Salinicola aestuarinus]|uniref:c-type cytochrome biogenesis protein CcmI n=1 Tax=Salinicola aestuarinus TaxID=1949082 RepID=UPI000DA1AC14|nr:c-type cytochrome biogenesis protein CcmI [Salinicola aestuarinus]
MTPLWIGIGLLTLLALALVAWPLRRAATLREAQLAFESKDTHNSENVAIYRQRLRSLEAELAAGEIDQQRFAQDRLELERRLLEDAEAKRGRALAAPNAGRWLLPVVALGVIVAGGALYDHFGAREDLALYRLVQSLEHLPPETQQAALEAEAERQPDNPDVWLELFPRYRDSGDYAKAAEAIEALIRLEGREPTLLAQLAQVKFFAADRTLTDDVRALVDETLAREPGQPVVNNLLGVEAFEHARYEQAIGYWRKALASYDEPKTVEALQQAVAAAQQRLGQDAAPAAAALRVQVTLDPRLAGRLPSDASVFLVARDSDGGRAPLAVTRTTLGALPQTLAINDDSAMTDAATLSQATRVDLLVRVSASGQAKPQPGDLYGRLDTVSLDDDASPTVVIDHVVPAP